MNWNILLLHSAVVARCEHRTEPHSPELARTSVLIQATGFLPSQFPHLQTSENTYPQSSSKVKCILSSKGKLLSIYTQHECVSTQHWPPGFPESPPLHADENWPGYTKQWHLSCVLLVLVRSSCTAKTATLSTLRHFHISMKTGNNFLDTLQKGLWTAKRGHLYLDDSMKIFFFLLGKMIIIKEKL